MSWCAFRAKFGTEASNNGRNSAKFGTSSANPDPDLTKFDQNRPGNDRAQPSLTGRRQNMGHSERRNHVILDRIFCCSPNCASGHFLQYVVDFGNLCAKIDQSWHTETNLEVPSTPGQARHGGSGPQISATQRQMVPVETLVWAAADFEPVLPRSPVYPQRNFPRAGLRDLPKTCRRAPTL